MENTNNIFEFPSDPFRMGDEIFLWGIPPLDLPSGSVANFHTDNELDIVYNERTKHYTVTVQTIRMFKSNSEQKEYLLYLLSEFTKWMNLHNYNTHEVLTLSDVFHWQYNQFPSVSKAYAWFKFMVDAYVEKYK